MQKIVGYISFTLAFFITITLYDHFLGTSIRWTSNIIMTIIAATVYILGSIIIGARRAKKENDKKSSSK